MSNFSSEQREVTEVSRSGISCSGVSRHGFSRSVLWLLRLFLAIQCFGVGASALEHGSPINGLLFGSSQTGGLDLTEQTAQLIDRIGGYGLLVAGVWILLRPCWPVLTAVAAWQFLIALAAAWVGGKAMSQYGLFGQSLRYITPLALVLLVVSTRPSSLPAMRITAIRITGFRITSALWMLRIATAAVFMAHGVEAILLHPEFLDYLIRAADLLLSWQVSQPTAESLLRMIGVIDIALAVTLLADRWWMVAAYMALWGLLTASSRVVHSGWENWPEAAMRGCNAGVPLVLGVYWFMQSREAALRQETKHSEDTLVNGCK